MRTSRGSVFLLNEMSSRIRRRASSMVGGAEPLQQFGAGERRRAVVLAERRHQLAVKIILIHAFTSSAVEVPVRHLASLRATSSMIALARLSASSIRHINSFKANA